MIDILLIALGVCVVFYICVMPFALLVWSLFQQRPNIPAPSSWGMDIRKPKEKKEET